MKWNLWMIFKKKVFSKKSLEINLLIQSNYLYSIHWNFKKINILNIKKDIWIITVCLKKILQRGRKTEPRVSVTWFISVVLQNIQNKKKIFTGWISIVSQYLLIGRPRLKITFFHWAHEEVMSNLTIKLPLHRKYFRLWKQCKQTEANIYIVWPIW